MIEILKNLFIGTATDYETQVKNFSNWAVIHACKEPYHRQLLGYTGRGAPKNHPEYLIAERGDRLFLNLVDAHKPDYIPKEIIDKALQNIEQKLAEQKKVLVHCNQGQSRSPTIGLLYLASIGEFSQLNFYQAEKEYLQYYPYYQPAFGIREFARINWHNYTH